MYGNTEQAAQILANKICQKGVTNIKMYDVSSTHVSYLIADSFKYSHIVLASVTYNLEIYPPMLNYLEEMRMLHLQKRTMAIIENGTWAVKSGDLMQKFIEERMKDMTLLNERVTISSSARGDKEKEFDDLAQAIVDSVKELKL